MQGLVATVEGRQVAVGNLRLLGTCCGAVSDDIASMDRTWRAQGQLLNDHCLVCWRQVNRGMSQQ